MINVYRTQHMFGNWYQFKPLILSMKEECADGGFLDQRYGTTHDEISKLLEVVTL